MMTVTPDFFFFKFCFLIGDANRQISEYKFKLSKAEQEMGTMEQNVSEKVNSLGKNQVPKPLVVTLKGLVGFFRLIDLKGKCPGTRQQLITQRK